METPDRIEIRPLAAADRTRLAQEFAHLSAETRRRRFGGVAIRLTEDDLDRLSNIDHHNHEAIAAIDPHTSQIVGIARYIVLPNEPGSAEVAIEVEDRWQGHGIGRRLINELIERARDEGMPRLVAFVGADNHLVRAWIVRAGGTVLSHAGDATVYTIPLDHLAEERKAA